jgi:hypothetical protein
MYNDRSKSSKPTNRKRKIIIYDEDEDAYSTTNTLTITSNSPIKVTTKGKQKLSSRMSNSSQDKTRPSSAASSTRHTAKKQPEQIKPPVFQPSQQKKKEMVRTDFKQKRKFACDTKSSSVMAKKLQTNSKKKIYVASIKFTHKDEIVSFPLFKDVDILSKRELDKHLIPQEMDNDIETDHEMMDDALVHTKKTLKQGIKEQKKKVK